MVTERDLSRTSAEILFTSEELVDTGQKTSAEIRKLKEVTQAMEKEVEETGTLSDDSMARFEVLQREAEVSQAKWESLEVELNALRKKQTNYEAAEYAFGTYSPFLLIYHWICLGISVTGFIFWYVKLQRYQDMIVKKQALEANKES